jgi:hypothetical protein
MTSLTQCVNESYLSSGPNIEISFEQFESRIASGYIPVSRVSNPNSNCCGSIMIQIAVLIWGIVILARQKATFGKSEVRGGPAILIGVLFVGTMPIAFVLGLLLGMYSLSMGISQDDLFMYSVFIDIGLLAFVVITAFVIASMFGNKPGDTPRHRNEPEAPPQQFVPPSDPDNPYSSPRT